LHIDRFENITQYLAVLVDCFDLLLETITRQRAHAIVGEFGLYTLRLVGQLLQGKMQAVAPFAEARIRFGKKPWDISD
jgi:hypothetical protein